MTKTLLALGVATATWVVTATALPPARLHADTPFAPNSTAQQQQQQLRQRQQPQPQPQPQQPQLRSQPQPQPQPQPLQPQPLQPHSHSQPQPQPQSRPQPQPQPQDPHRQMHARGAQAMGFDQAATTHHFFLYPDGGAIQVTVNDANDQVNLAAIRTHLPHIAAMFASGDFSTPHFVHAADVPGTTALEQLRAQIAYAYAERPGGGRVRITTRDAKALSAVHAFLRYQITDHKTGDPLTVGPEKP